MNVRGLKLTVCGSFQGTVVVAIMTLLIYSVTKCKFRVCRSGKGSALVDVLLLTVVLPFMTVVVPLFGVFAS